MERVREFTYPSADGEHQIYATVWLPEGEPKAVVQIVHGVAEYAGRYDAFARWLADRGFAVCGEDHLGHGKTVDDGKYGYFGKKDGWTLVTADVRQLRVLMGERFPGAPYFLLGHSMGSFLARTYLCKYPGTVDGCILSGTGQEPPALVAAGKAVASAICAVKGPETVSPLVNRLSLPIQYGTGNEPSVIVEIPAAYGSSPVQIHPDGIPILAKVNLSIFLIAQHGHHHKGSIEKFYAFRPL